MLTLFRSFDSGCRDGARREEGGGGRCWWLCYVCVWWAADVLVGVIALPLASGGPWVLLVWITCWWGDRRICVWPLEPSWPDTKHGNAVTLYVYVCRVCVCQRSWGEAEKVCDDGKGKRQTMWVCICGNGRNERLVSIRAGQWVVYLCEQVHAWLFIDSAKLGRITGIHMRLWKRLAGFHLIPESQINKWGLPDLNPDQ